MLQDNTICQIPDPKVILTPDVCGNAFFNVTYIMKHISDKGWVSLSVLHQRVATYSETLDSKDIWLLACWSFFRSCDLPGKPHKLLLCLMYLWQAFIFKNKKNIIMTVLTTQCIFFLRLSLNQGIQIFKMLACMCLNILDVLAQHKCHHWDKTTSTYYHSSFFSITKYQDKDISSITSMMPLHKWYCGKWSL